MHLILGHYREDLYHICYERGALDLIGLRSAIQLNLQSQQGCCAGIIWHFVVLWDMAVRGSALAHSSACSFAGHSAIVPQVP